MEREIGRWNKATGIKRPLANQPNSDPKWEELWIGDVISARVYITDEQGGYLHVTGDVLWDEQYGMYVLHGTYTTGDRAYTNSFPLHKVVNEPVKYITKAPRFIGHQRDIIFQVLQMLRSYQQAPVELHDYLEKANPDTRDGITTYGTDDIESIVSTVVYDAMDTISSEIEGFGVVPKEEIREFMEATR